MVEEKEMEQVEEKEEVLVTCLFWTSYFHSVNIGTILPYWLINCIKNYFIMININLKYVWQTTPAPKLCVSPRNPPLEIPSFGTWWTVLAPFSVWERPNKNKSISRKQNSTLNHFLQLFFLTFPPPLDQYNIFWPYKKRAPKPLLGCQNWVTLIGGCHKVPGDTRNVGGRCGLSYVYFLDYIE